MRTPPERLISMRTPRSPRESNARLASAACSDQIQSGNREFHEMLDEKLRDIRNWAVEEHHQRLEMLQAKNRTLQSMLASQIVRTPKYPLQGPRARSFEGLNQVGLDHECDEPPNSARESGKTTFRISHALESEDSVLTLVSTTLSPVERWLHIVDNMLQINSRMSRIGNAGNHVWHLNATWIAAKRELINKQSSPEDVSQVVIAAFGALEHEGGAIGRISMGKEQSIRSQGAATATLALKGRTPHSCTDSFVRCLSLVQPIWNLFRLLLALYDTIMIPVFTFLTDDLVYARPVGWSSRIFWTLDLGMRLICDSGNGVDRITCCRRTLQYLNGWFAFDFVIVLSDWFWLLSQTSPNSPGAFLRVVHVVRIGKQRGVDHDHWSTIIIYMLEAIFAYVIVIHVWACVWYGVGNATSDGWTQEPILESAWVIHKYLTSVGWAASQMNGVSVSDAFRMNTYELAFSALSIFIGFILFMFVLGRAVNAEAVRFRSHQMAESEICVNFCKENRLPPDLRLRALMYFRNKEDQSRLRERIQNEDDFLSSLPKSLRMDVKEQLLGQFCKNIEFFRALDSIASTMIRKVCESAVSIVLCFTDEVVFVEGDICNTAYIVQNGQFSYKIGRNCTKDGANNIVMSATAVFDSERRAANDDGSDCRNLDIGRHVSEAVIWTKWVHAGNLYSLSHATLLALQPQGVTQLVLEREDTTTIACHYASRFVSQLNDAVITSDLFCYRVAADMEWKDASNDEDSGRHFAFLSHFKAEAGTEATLMHRELNGIIFEQVSHPANKLLSPVFIDSADLNDLSQLRVHVEKSQNLILLLTPGILSRPWCVLEICVAVQENNCIIPVHVQRPGLPAFDYPGEEFYQKLRSGDVLNKQGMDLLKDEGFEVTAVEASIRRVFMRIALPFSPHKSDAVRKAELHDIFARCESSDENQQVSTHHSRVSRTPPSGSLYPSNNKQSAISITHDV